MCCILTLNSHCKFGDLDEEILLDMYNLHKQFMRSLDLKREYRYGFSPRNVTSSAILYFDASGSLTTQAQMLLPCNVTGVHVTTLVTLSVSVSLSPEAGILGLLRRSRKQHSKALLPFLFPSPMLG